MTLQEVGQVMDILKAIYPTFYAKQTEDERYNAMLLWASLFEPYPAELVLAAVKGFIGADTKGFPPVPGQILDKLRTITEPQKLGEAEAWAMVRRACANGLYGAKKEFEKLPPEVQKLVGSPNRLREWAMMDGETVESVVASHFQRAYRQEMQRKAEYEAIPGDVRELVGVVSARLEAHSRELAKGEP